MTGVLAKQFSSGWRPNSTSGPQHQLRDVRRPRSRRIRPVPAMLLMQEIPPPVCGNFGFAFLHNTVFIAPDPSQTPENGFVFPERTHLQTPLQTA
jgi:hypothetical protein